MSNNVHEYIEASYQELEGSLNPRELKQALARKGDQLLHRLISDHVNNRFSVYDKLFLALEGPAAKNSKEAVKLSQITEPRPSGKIGAGG